MLRSAGGGREPSGGGAGVHQTDGAAGEGGGRPVPAPRSPPPEGFKGFLKNFSRQNQISLFYSDPHHIPRQWLTDQLSAVVLFSTPRYYSPEAWRFAFVWICEVIAYGAELFAFPPPKDDNEWTVASDLLSDFCIDL